MRSTGIAVLRTEQKREGRFTPIPEVIRIMSNQKACEICGAEYKKFAEGATIWMPVQALHHIFSRRFLNRIKLNEHDRLNMISLCDRCHGKAKKPEERLFHGDVFGFLQGYKAMGMPMSYVWRAARQYELVEVLSWFRTESELR